LLPALRAAGAAWWQRYPGQDWDDYCRREMVRPVVTHLRVSTPPTRLDQGEPVEITLSIGMGVLAGRSGDRYGGHDELVVRADGQPVAEWSCDWLWLDLRSAGMAGFLRHPPRNLGVDLVELARPARRPDVAGGRDLDFRWTRRETDLNGHVFFLCYLERAENALADVDHGFDANEWELWYTMPSFVGERMRLSLPERDPAAGRHGSIRAADDGRLCATFRTH
jgi:hypothetical protein